MDDGIPPSVDEPTPPRDADGTAESLAPEVRLDPLDDRTAGGVVNMSVPR